jgi:hypothetical protein
MADFGEFIRPKLMKLMMRRDFPTCRSPLRFIIPIASKSQSMPHLARVLSAIPKSLPAERASQAKQMKSNIGRKKIAAPPRQAGTARS